MTAGSRLQVQVVDFFFFHLLFKNTLCSKVKEGKLAAMIGKLSNIQMKIMLFIFRVSSSTKSVPNLNVYKDPVQCFHTIAAQ